MDKSKGCKGENNKYGKDRRKSGRERKTWVEIIRVKAATTARNLAQDQLRNREKWRFGPERRRQLL
jgi:hypothetical protein